MIELKDKDGNFSTTLDPAKAPYWFNCVTIWGGKVYEIVFGHPKDPRTHEPDKTKISGVILRKKE